jgi:hypothetical protein
VWCASRLCGGDGYDVKRGDLERRRRRCDSGGEMAKLFGAFAGLVRCRAVLFRIIGS